MLKRTYPLIEELCVYLSDSRFIADNSEDGRCLCKPVSMLGPDGRAMPLPDDDDVSESGSSDSNTVIPSGTIASARTSGIQEGPNKARHRVQKNKKCSGSMVDPRAVARAVDSGLLPVMGLQSQEAVGNHVNSFANGAMEAAQPGFVSHSPYFAQPSFPMPTFPPPPRPGPRPEYGPVHQSEMRFGGEHNSQVSAYPDINHQKGSNAYPQAGPLLSSHTPLPNSNGYLDHGWVSQAQGFANLYPGESRNGHMVESNAMIAQCNHHTSPESGPTSSQLVQGIIADHIPNHFRFHNSSIDTGHSYMRPASYPATAHPMATRETKGLVGLSEGFMERFPASSSEETTYSNTVPGTQSNFPRQSHNCECGKDCRCFACPEHPDNATTRARTAALSRIMVADGLLDPVDLQDMSFDGHNINPDGPRTNGGTSSPTSTSGPEMMNPQNEENTHQTLSPWHEQGQPLDVDLSSDYWTYEIPVEPSGCTCGENCTCTNCLIHGDRVSAQPPSGSQNSASQHSNITNRHG
ncbi:hypothetical protein MMC30_000567 [Trapelia coarctata]|nr:hypothetical protein [Trapelia coarctata]